MSMVAMAAPAPHSSFNRDYPWNGPRILTDYAPRQTERITLPCIRQAIPELQLRIPSPQDPRTRTPSTTTSPTTGIVTTVTTPPAYIHSPNSNKRRRYSIEDRAGSERASRVPRLYSATPLSIRQSSPTMAPRTPASESWAGSAKTSPFLTSGAAHVTRSPITMEIPDRSMERRPTLPSLTLSHAPYEREQPQPILRSRGPSQDDYPHQRPLPLSAGAPQLETPPHSAHYRTNPFTYPYHHPTRGQSLSVGSIHPFDRSPYAGAPPPPHVGYPYHHDFVRFGGEMGYGGMGMTMGMGMGMGGVGPSDPKQGGRKRRGNLPKETTDKLRAWFVAHLHHPYPTEDEKQELMRQTGLQMNQISNWFINARRRQLPHLVNNNPRPESDAVNSSSASSSLSPGVTTSERKMGSGTEAHNFHHKSPRSDGEAGSFDDDLRVKRQRGGHVKRGSI